MKTTEEKAMEYSQSFYPAQKDMQFQCEMHFEAGAEWMRTELTRWNKLEEPPEIPTGRWRSKRVLLKKESGDYATGWAELTNGQIRWTDGRVVFANLIGWREIHE